MGDLGACAFAFLLGNSSPFPESSPSLTLRSLEVAIEIVFARVLKLLAVSFKRVVGDKPVIKVGAAQ